MKIALVQIASPDVETPQHRLERVWWQLTTFRDDVDLIVLPELWKVGYNHFDDYRVCAEPVDGSTVQLLSSIARQRQCLLHIGTIVESTVGGHLRNTAVLIGADGQILHWYSKIHVFGYQSREANLLEPGNHISAAETAFGAVAATTCYDLRFPGLWTQLVDAGAELVVVPAAWPMRRLSHWRLLSTARAVDNQVYVIACNATGVHAGVELAGHSRIVDPWGGLVVEATADEGITIAEIQPAMVAAARAEFPVLADRLTTYTDLSTKEALA
jgi:predicted amidohydrolase